jgi:hypothetical protein
MANFIARMENAEAVLGIVQAGLKTGVLAIHVPDTAVAVIDRAGDAPTDDFDMLGYMDAESRVAQATAEIIAEVENSLSEQQRDVTNRANEEHRRSQSAVSACEREIRDAEYTKSKYKAGMFEKAGAALSIPGLKRKLEETKVIEESRYVPYRQKKDSVDAAATAVVAKLQPHKLDAPGVPRERLRPRSG